MQFLKSGEGGVEVCLVEYFAAADQVAFDSQDVDHPPLGVEAFLRGPSASTGEDRSEAAQPMHGLDVDADVGREVPHGTDVCGEITRLDVMTGRWSMVTQSGVVAGVRAG